MLHFSARAWRCTNAASLAAATVLLISCGGGGSAALPAPSDTGSPGSSTPVASVDYPESLALGAASAQDLQFTAAVGATQAVVVAAQATALLKLGSNPLTAVHTDAALPGVVVACVSGAGDTTNVVTGINLGVLGRSAAVLLSAGWAATDSPAAWAKTSAAGGAWVGWENCGLKPEGSPSPSSLLTAQTDGSYAELVYDGNPSTTFQALTQHVSADRVAAMLSLAGYLTTDDPTRPLQLTLRAFEDASGRVLWIERGEPAPAAPASTRGFIALYEAAAS